MRIKKLPRLFHLTLTLSFERRGNKNQPLSVLKEKSGIITGGNRIKMQLKSLSFQRRG